MRGQTVSVAAAALLSALPSAYAGKAYVHNGCDFEVYSWSVDCDQNPEKPTIISPGGTYSEEFRTVASGGVSIKMSPTDDMYDPITQLEYTLNDKLWYDVSNVDCTGTECPFQKHGLYLQAGADCAHVSCIAGNLTCSGAYTLWNDDWASLCCEESDPDINLYLCQDSATGSSGGYSSPTVEDTDTSVYKPKHKHHHQYTTTSSSTSSYVAPTSYDPATVVVEVTQYDTVVATVTPTPKPGSYGTYQDQSADTEDTSEGDEETEKLRARRRRHIHNHMDVHRHRH